MWLHQHTMRCAQRLLAAASLSFSHWKLEIQVEFSSSPDVHFCSSPQLGPTRGREIGGIRCAVSQGFPRVMMWCMAPRGRRGREDNREWAPQQLHTRRVTYITYSRGREKVLSCNMKTLRKELLQKKLLSRPLAMLILFL